MEIFLAPKEIKKPVLNFDDIEAWRKDEERYIEEIKQSCLKANKGKYIGEILYFPVGDGNAMYMVMTDNPFRLVHLELGDCWEFQYIDRLTPQDIIEKIEQQKAMAELFSK